MLNTADESLSDMSFAGYLDLSWRMEIGETDDMKSLVHLSNILIRLWKVKHLQIHAGTKLCWLGQVQWKSDYPKSCCMNTKKRVTTFSLVRCSIEGPGSDEHERMACEDCSLWPIEGCGKTGQGLPRAVALNMDVDKLSIHYIYDLNISIINYC